MLILSTRASREMVKAIDANTEALKRLESRVDNKADA